MAIEDPPPVSVKPLSGTASWANFEENTDLGWSGTYTCSYHHQNTDWVAKGSQCESDWHDICHTDSKTEWQDFNHTEAREEGSQRESLTEWQDFDNTDSKLEWQDFSHTSENTSNSHGRVISSPVASDTGHSYEVFHECFPCTCTCSDRLSLPFHPLNTCR